MRAATIFPLMLFLGGCLSLTYDEVDGSTLSANVTFKKGYDTGIGSNAIDNYAVSNTDDCDDIGLAARFLSTTGNSSVVRIPAGRRIRIIAHVEYSVGTGVSGTGTPGAYIVNTRNFPCTNSASFLPLVGASYSVINKSDRSGRCRFEIIDQSTNMPPSGISIQAGSGCPKGYAVRYGAITFYD